MKNTINHYETKTTRRSKILPVMLSLLIALAVGTTIFAQQLPKLVYAAGSSFVLGDVDKDGKVTAADARLALRAAVGLETYKKGSDEFKRADYDESGDLTAADARCILRVAVGLNPNDTTGPDYSWSIEDEPGYDDPYYTLEGASSYDPNRIGMYYYLGVRVNYEDIPEGGHYVYYDEYGWQVAAEKPYSPGNEPPAVDPYHCEFCGKSNVGVDGHYACASGGCSRWIIDVNCPECGKFVPANTCHTCK